jgi:hypothetical protein
MSLHPFRRAKFLELTPTAGSIGVIPENDFLPISSVEQMVESPGKFHPSFACHPSSLPAIERICRAKLPRFTDFSESGCQGDIVVVPIKKLSE